MRPLPQFTRGVGLGAPEDLGLYFFLPDLKSGDWRSEDAKSLALFTCLRPVSLVRHSCCHRLGLVLALKGI